MNSKYHESRQAVFDGESQPDVRSEESGQRWAITGASGYIGRALVERLRSDRIPVRGLYRSGLPSADRVEPIAGDLDAADALRRLVTGAGVVVHLAAYVHRRADTPEEREQCYRVNVGGTKRLLEVVEKCAPQAFFVFVSSANVYPTSSIPIDETVEPDPRSFYGETKFEAEQVVLDAVRDGRVRAVVLRPTLVFGVEGPGNLSRLIAMLQKRVLPVVGGVQNLKSLVPVDMLIDAIVGVAKKQDECNGETFNVAGGALTLQRITDLVCEELGVRPITVRLPAKPTLWIASIGDAICGRLRIPVPNLEQMVNTYTASTVISDEKIRRIVTLGATDEVEAALRATVRSVKIGSSERSANKSAAGEGPVVT